MMFSETHNQPIVTQQGTESTAPTPAQASLSPITIQAAGEQIELLPERAAFWTRTRTLFLSDVHLGKAQTLAATGIGLPGEAILDSQLRAFDRVIQRVNALRVFIIGDLIHAPVGLTAPLIEKVTAWRSSCTTEMFLIPGNHDRKIERVSVPWKIQMTDLVYQEGPFTFTHDPTASTSAGGYRWSGHIHPAAFLRQGKGGLKIPCFHVGQNFTVLPAFSPFTGGVAIRPTGSEQLFGIVSDRVIAL